MGFVRKRVDNTGRTRYLALYQDVKGRQRSAGTYATFTQAEKAWLKAEDRMLEGRLGDASRGRQKFARYVEEQWLPHHQMEARTRENYTYYLNRHILPAFGTMRLIEILPGDIRSWVTDLQAQGVSVSVIRSCYAVLSAVFTTALNDQLTQLHPCKGVKLPPVPRTHRDIVSPEQFDALYAQLPNEASRLLVELDVETGLRWGELTELRPIDFDVPRRTLTIRRTAQEVVRTFHPDGARFLIKQYPKDREHRPVRISQDVADTLYAHMKKHQVARDGLIFTVDMLNHDPADDTGDAVDAADLGMTKPNPAGRTYPHGTTTAYNMAPCRCPHCRHAYATYRAQRRALGKDQHVNPAFSTGDLAKAESAHSAAQTVAADPDNPDRHISRNWFRRHIWQPTLTAAGLPPNIRTHDLRHAHASWLLAGGADLQTVKERLGHGNIRTTQQYLHTLTGPDDTALDALHRIRHR